MEALTQQQTMLNMTMSAITPAMMAMIPKMPIGVFTVGFVVGWTFPDEVRLLLIEAVSTIINNG